MIEVLKWVEIQNNNNNKNLRLLNVSNATLRPPCYYVSNDIFIHSLCCPCCVLYACTRLPLCTLCALLILLASLVYTAYVHTGHIAYSIDNQKHIQHKKNPDSKSTFILQPDTHKKY